MWALRNKYTLSGRNFFKYTYEFYIINICEEKEIDVYNIDACNRHIFLPKARGVYSVNIQQAFSVELLVLEFWPDSNKVISSCLLKFPYIAAQHRILLHFSSHLKCYSILKNSFVYHSKGDCFALMSEAILLR